MQICLQEFQNVNLWQDTRMDRHAVNVEARGNCSKIQVHDSYPWDMTLHLLWDTLVQEIPMIYKRHNFGGLRVASPVRVLSSWCNIHAEWCNIHAESWWAFSVEHSPISWSNQHRFHLHKYQGSLSVKAVNGALQLSLVPCIFTCLRQWLSWSGKLSVKSVRKRCKSLALMVHTCPLAAARYCSACLFQVYTKLLYDMICKSGALYHSQEYCRREGWMSFSAVWKSTSTLCKSGSSDR